MQSSLPKTAEAFRILGIAPTQDMKQVRDAYHLRVKQYHPDRFQPGPEQETAQQKLIELNLAYEECIRLAQSSRPFFSALPLDQALSLAEKLYAQSEFSAGLRQLSRADRKNADWYCMEGRLLMALREYAAAHRSFREAVRQDPDNLRYRSFALDAAVEVRKSHTFTGRLRGLARELFKR